MSPKLHLNWGAKRTGFLSEKEKKYILDRLNLRAGLHPEGFDIEFSDELGEVQVLEYLKEFEIIVVRVGKAGDSFCLAIYQNESDKINREAKR